VPDLASAVLFRGFGLKFAKQLHLKQKERASNSLVFLTLIVGLMPFFDTLVRKRAPEELDALRRE